MSASETEAFRRQVAAEFEAIRQRVTVLENMATVLRREAVNTRRKMRQVERKVERLPDRDEMRAMLAEADAANADRLRVAVSAWPPGAVAAVTVAGAVLVGILLIAVGAIHLG